MNDRPEVNMRVSGLALKVGGPMLQMCLKIIQLWNGRHKTGLGLGLGFSIAHVSTNTPTRYTLFHRQFLAYLFSYLAIPFS